MTATYDKVGGCRTSMSDGSGSTSWKYDTRGRLSRETKTITGHSAFVTEFAYNSADLPTAMTYPDGDPSTSLRTRVVGYEYNSRMVLDIVIGDATYVSNMNFDSAGRMTSRALGNGLTQNFGYYVWNEKVNNIGQGGRLETLVTGALQNLSYQYDAVGNVKQIVDSHAGETSTYEYDELNRLRFWTLNGVTEEYSYDSQGNLDVKNGLDLEYEDANHVHAVTHIGSTQKYWYDQNGNQVTRIVGADTYTQVYDAENRMTEVKKNNVTMARFDYNGDGQRVKSIVNGETVYFAGGHFEFNDTTDEVTKYYFAGMSRIAVRKYIVPETTTLTYLLGDHLGSTSLAVDADTGDVVETRYKPWGEVRWTTPSETLPTRYTFTGQYSHMDDSATDLGAAGFGLMFYNARWYDPMTGRMSQADTIVPGGVQGLDRYAYVNNSPVMYIDPTGHIICQEGQIASGGKCVNSGDGNVESGSSNGGSGVDTSGLDFTGYSDWEKELLLFLYINGGPDAQNGVLYILENHIHITVGNLPFGLDKDRGAWFNEGTNTIVLKKGPYSLDTMPDNWGLSLIIHEARHLEQGTELSHSKLGEMDAWQIQFRVLRSLGETLTEDEKTVLEAQTLEDFTTAIQTHWPSYWKNENGWGLYTYPDSPNYCFSLIGCGPEVPWWLRINLP